MADGTRQRNLKTEGIQGRDLQMISLGGRDSLKGFGNRRHLGKDSWMIFLGRWDLRKGFGNRKDSWKGLVDLLKGFMDNIPGQMGLAEGIHG